MLNLSGTDCRLTNSRPKFFYLRRILEMFHSNKSKLHTRTAFAVLRVRELFQFSLQPPPFFVQNKTQNFGFEFFFIKDKKLIVLLVILLYAEKRSLVFSVFAVLPIKYPDILFCIRKRRICLLRNKSLRKGKLLWNLIKS